jgi:hypothetical protein
MMTCGTTLHVCLGPLCGAAVQSVCLFGLVNLVAVLVGLNFSVVWVIAISSPETSVSNHLTPRNNPEDGRVHVNRGRSLRFRMLVACFVTNVGVKEVFYLFYVGVKFVWFLTPEKEYVKVKSR